MAKGFPVTTKRNYDNIADKVSAESMPVYGTIGQYSGTWTAVQGLMSFTVFPSQCWWLQTPMMVSSTIDADFTVTIAPGSGVSGATINPGQVNPGFKISLKAGQPITFPLTQPLPENTVITLYGAAANSNTGATVYGGFGAVKTSNRILNKKERRCLIISDSIGDGTQAIQYGSQLYTWIALQSLAPKYQFEPVHKTQQSANSIHTYNLLQTQRINWNDYDMIYYNIMTNDNTVPLQTNFQQTFDLFCSLKQLEAPTVPCIVGICTSRVGSVNDTVEVNRAYARTKIDGLISSGDTTFARCNLDTLWSAANANTYTIDGLHPNIASNVTMGNFLATTMRTFFPA